MKKLKHKGRDVKMESKSNPCSECIFFDKKQDNCELNKANDFEIKNKLPDCDNEKVKYIYDEDPNAKDKAGLNPSL